MNKINFFRQSLSKLTMHAGLLYVKKTHPRLRHAWAPLKIAPKQVKLNVC
jgi:hypothetical protein